MADITYIPIRQLYPHPDNPRKELGDLSELAASIKENGVYQNLTVIHGHYLNSREYIAKCVDEGGDASAAAAAWTPKAVWSSEDYTIIIGHRRTAVVRVIGARNGTGRQARASSFTAKMMTLTAPMNCSLHSVTKWPMMKRLCKTAPTSFLRCMVPAARLTRPAISAKLLTLNATSAAKLAMTTAMRSSCAERSMANDRPCKV